MTPPRRPDDDPPPPLPVAEPARPGPDEEPVDAELVGPDEEPADLPVAVPVRPPRAARREPPRRREHREPEPRDDAPARPRVLAACAVIGCLGVCLIAAVGFLAYGAILILNHLGDRVAPDPDRPAGVAGDGARLVLIRPTALATRTATVEVGGEYDAVGRAAGGRYLLFRIPTAPARIVAFDANTGALVPGFEVKLAESSSLFAGGAAKLWVYKPRAHELVRVDLLTGRVERQAPAPRDAAGKVQAVAIGALSDGPVYLVGGGRRQTDVWLLDGTELTQSGFVRFPEGVGTVARARAPDVGSLLVVSGDRGSAVVRPAPAAGRSGFQLLKADDGSSPAFATPSPDGRYVHTPAGVFTPDGGRPFRPDGADPFTVPAAQGYFYLSLNVSGIGALTGPVRVHPAGSRAVAGTLAEITIPRGVRATDAGDVTSDQRAVYWPGAGLAAVLPPDNTSIKLWKVDPPAGRPDPRD